MPFCVMCTVRPISPKRQPLNLINFPFIYMTWMSTDSVYCLSVYFELVRGTNSPIKRT